MPDGQPKAAVQAPIARAAGDIGAFEQYLGTWFDNSMEKLSAQYKRFSGYLSLALGAALAFFFNIDAIRVAKALWLSDTLRQQAVAVASTEAANAYLDCNS
jgi:hypothetical protein